MARHLVLAEQCNRPSSSIQEIIALIDECIYNRLQYQERKASMQIDGFNWDNGNWPKCEQHGVSKAAIEWALSAPFTQLPDPHTGAEERFRAIGHDEIGRYLFIVFCIRELDEKTLIRPISARYMHRKEIESYERQR